MRAYGMLLGLAVTVGYGFAANVAVWPSGVGRAAATPLPKVFRVEEAPGPVWYGGTLDPVTVEARGDSPAATAVARRWLLDHSSTRCSKLPTRYSPAL